MNLNEWVGVTTVLANAAAFLGIPLAVIVLIVDRRRARQEREQQTYQALQSEYSEFLKLCLENPQLQLHDYRPDSKAEISPEEKGQRMVALEILVSMLESAFFFYHHGHDSEFKSRQWTGWEEYMRAWASRKSFREAWKEHLGAQFDAESMRYMNSLIDDCERAAQHATAVDRPPAGRRVATRSAASGQG